MVEPLCARTACTALLADSSLVVSIVGEVEEAESFVLSQSLAMEEESDGEQETAAEGEESERVGSGATHKGDSGVSHLTAWFVCKFSVRMCSVCRISVRRSLRGRL